MENTQYDFIPNYKKIKDKVELEFDYELNCVKMEDSQDLNSKLYIKDKETKKYRT